MKSHFRFQKTLLIAGAAAAILTAIAVTAPPAEASHAFNVIGKARVFGRSYSDWSTRWWKWVRSFPAAQSPSDPENPLFEGDPNNFVPVDCSRGQRGLVWFLPGTSGGVAKRSCTIPRGRALFFPLVNALFWNAQSTTACTVDSDCPADNACDAGFCGENFSVDDKRTSLAPLLDGLCTPIAELDGRPLVFDEIATVRTQSRPFRSVAGPNDPFGAIDGNVDNKAVSDGVWAMLPYLTPGQHELRFGGAVCFGGQEVFSNEAVYQITVP